MKVNTKEHAKTIIQAIRRGNKIICIGNGGSATMASHFAGELVGKYKYNRRALPAISLFDLASFTATANDFGYENVFVRQLGAFGNKGDILLALSTSGKSKNVLKAIKWAERHGLIVIDLERKGRDTPQIQENQLKLLHKIAEEVEKAFI